MGSARILECAVNVEKKPFGDDVVYTVSGEGAQRLWQKCIFATRQAHPSFNTANNSFMVRESAFNDSFEALQILTGLQQATKARGRG